MGWTGFGTVWTFNTARFSVSLEITQTFEPYEGDDEDGSIARDLESGKLVMFDSKVSVELDGVEIGADYLGASTYKYNELEEFWNAHADPDPMNRNCSIMHAARGENVSICHYFPDMVREAISQARQHLSNAPKVRSAA